jgi:SAM-dependent methyltransferase
MPEPDRSEHYKSGTPPWETGQPSAELARVVVEQKIAPCRVIELGCGSGINAVWLAQQGFEVTGIDITPLAIEQARQRAGDAGVKVRFEVGDVLKLPKEKDPYPFFFDRGCYHAVRQIDAAAYVRSLVNVTTAGARGLILAGNAREPSPEGQGPPVVSAEQLHAELEPAFKIVRLREFRFDANVPGNPSPLGWSCWLTRA